MLNQEINVNKQSVVKLDDLKSDCSNCFGLCCVALYFSKMDGFPKDKKASEPCLNLCEGYKCSIHEQLSDKGYKGCLSYDCLGAGQKISTLLFNNKNWKEHPNQKQMMFDLLPVIHQYHELLFYLYQVNQLTAMTDYKDQINQLMDEIQEVTLLKPEQIMNVDLLLYRMRVNELLVICSERERHLAIKRFNIDVKKQKAYKRGANLMGRDLKNATLVGANLRGAYLIGADFSGVSLHKADVIGADFRDALIKGADLSETLFLTQQQLNAARGNQLTKIPLLLSRPTHWE